MDDGGKATIHQDHAPTSNPYIAADSKISTKIHNTHMYHFIVFFHFPFSLFFYPVSERSIP